MKFVPLYEAKNRLFELVARLRVLREGTRLDGALKTLARQGLDE